MSSSLVSLLQQTGMNVSGLERFSGLKVVVDSLKECCFRRVQTFNTTFSLSPVVMK